MPAHANRRPPYRVLMLALVLAAVSVLPASLADDSDRQGEALRRADAKAWIGVWLGDSVDGGVEIVALVPGGPAERAGLLAGDIIPEATRKPSSVWSSSTWTFEPRRPCHLTR